MNERWFLTLLILFLVGLMWLKPVWGWQLRAYLSPPHSPTFATDKIISENQALKNELSQLRDARRSPGSYTGMALPASVFSRYPFNAKNELLLSVGRDQGVSLGDSVIIPVSAGEDGRQQSILVGRIERLFDTTSVARTIFDGQWRSTVRVGMAGAQALLNGGAEPQLSLIPKDTALNTGDLVYNADPRFPYGLVIGEIRSAGVTADTTSKEALVRFAYDLNAQQQVFVVQDYEAPIVR